MQLQSIPPMLPVRAFRAGVCLVLFFSLISAGAARSGPSSADLRSKDASVRLTAAQAVIAEGGSELPIILRRLLKDDDWEIAILAAKSLAEFGDEKDLRLLAELAVTAPIRELRMAAAQSMAKLDAPAANEALLKKLGAQPAYTCEALTLVASLLEKPELPAELAPLLMSESAGVRVAAAEAMLTFARLSPEATFREVLESGYLGVRTRGLELAMRYPHASMVGPLRQLLAQAKINDVVLRRAVPATIAALDAMQDGAAGLFTETLQALCQDELPEVALRAALLGELAVDKPWAKDLDLLRMTIMLRRHDDPSVRTAAANMLRTLKGPETQKVAFAMFNRERDGRVRLALLKAILVFQPVGSNAGMHWAIKQLKSAPSPEIAEVLVVALGHRKFVEETAVAGALVEALEFPDWTVAACAAVSLGRTRNRWGAKSLITMATTHADWKLRGAAVVGLTQVKRASCIPALITALADKDPAVAETAMSYLSSLRRGDSFGTDHKDWSVWWNKAEGEVELYKMGGKIDREERFGPDASREIIFQGMDLMVMDGKEGALIKALEREGIKHRSIPHGSLQAAALNARGALVVNCASPWSEAELERLRWFVKVGGLLSGSGGGSGETVQQVEPGLLGVLETKQKPAGHVIANVQRKESTFTRGVFGPDALPLSQLDGGHLIEVLQPERVEVLIESPESAERWGGGNLSCWFRAGHGTLLDLASPMAEPQFPRALRLKKPHQRMAFAVNHMGTSLALIRETVGEKSWKSDSQAAQYITDDSMLRLLTNFVRQRRLMGW